MFKKILYSIVIAILIFSSIALFLPRYVHVERQVSIQRPAATVFTVLNDYNRFLAWSPWTDRDRAARIRVSDPGNGVGARITWRGDPRLVGSGWQEITASQPYSMVRMRMEFDQQGAAESAFYIDQDPAGVTVTWVFETDLLQGRSWISGLLARYFGLFFDRWIGADYEVGLGRLKALVESMPAGDFANLAAERVEAEVHDVLYISNRAEEGAIDGNFDLAGAYREIIAFMTAHSIDRAAPPMTITRGAVAGQRELIAAIPVVHGDVALSGRVRRGLSPAGQVLRVAHRGPYQDLEASYSMASAWIAAHGFTEQPVSWEQYLSDPGATPPEELLTHIYFRIEDAR
jgi:effector-binding domain-containing protein